MEKPLTGRVLSDLMVSNRERKLIERLRRLEFGQHDWLIFMENREPVRIEQRQGAESIKL